MQIENDYDKEVYNGDIGYIDVDPNVGELAAHFDGRVTYGFGELDTLVPALRRFTRASGRNTLRWSYR